MEHHRLLLKFRLYGLLFVALQGWLAWYQASLGHTIIATLVALPVVAMILAVVSPLAGPGHFALTQELGGVADSPLTLRQQEIQKALWWLLGSCLLPLGALLAFVVGITGWFEKGHAIFVVFGGLLPLVGIACLLKAAGAFFRAWRANT